MKPGLRAISNLLLALVIALTSGAMAVARGQAQSAAGSIVLCTGTGPVSVEVDADGNPVGPLHICPDCALSLFDAAALAPAVVAVQGRVRRLAAAPVPQGADLSELPAPRARAPPLS